MVHLPHLGWLSRVNSLHTSWNVLFWVNFIFYCHQLRFNECLTDFQWNIRTGKKKKKVMLISQCVWSIFWLAYLKMLFRKERRLINNISSIPPPCRWLVESHNMTHMHKSCTTGNLFLCCCFLPNKATLPDDLICPPNRDGETEKSGGMGAEVGNVIAVNEAMICRMFPSF